MTRLVELEAAESERAGVEATFRISRCTQNDVVPMVTVVPPSDANGSQWHHAMTTGGDSGATSPVATTGGAIENDCYDKVAPLSPLAPAIGDPLEVQTIPGWIDPCPASTGSGSDVVEGDDPHWGPRAA